MEELFNKYERKFDLTRKQLKQIVSEALKSDSREEKLVELFGYDNLDDVSFLCSNEVKVIEFINNKIYEIIEMSNYTEHKFDLIENRKSSDSILISINEVKNGKRYFSFEYFNNVQSLVFECLYKSDLNVLVSAPTGCGKTEIAMLAIIRAKELRKGKIIYIAPMKALATEITEKFKRTLEGLSVCEFTGDTEITSREAQNYNIFVCTPEKFDVVTRRHGNIFESSLSLIIIDEIHILQDERGAVLESIVCKIFKYAELKQTHIRIVGLSATLPNSEDVAKFIKAAKSFKFDDSYRPVSLDISILGVYGKRKKDGSRKGVASDQQITDVCVEKIEEINVNRKQILVFVHSRSDTISTARRIADIYMNSENVSHKRTFENAILNHLLMKRLGVHHAGLPRNIRHKMEELFLKGEIRILVCTSTLAWGVNLPASIVIIKGTTFYDGIKGRFSDVSILDIVQIFGRAGRPQFESSGSALLLTSRDKLDHFTNLLAMKSPIESQFLNSVIDFINSEINLNNVESVSDILSWIKDTFLYVRINKNAFAYGVNTNIESIDSALNEYIVVALNKLQEAKLIQIQYECGMAFEHYPTWRFYCTNLGRIASFFYIAHGTMIIWTEMLKKTFSENEILILLTSSLEFSNIVYRDNEYGTLKELSEDFKIDFVESNSCKMVILIISQIRKLKLFTFSLDCDRNFIIHNLKRLCQAFAHFIIEMKRFDLLQMTCDLLVKLKVLRRVPTKKVVIKMIKLLNFMRIIISGLEKTFNYVILTEGSNVLFADIFNGNCQFFCPIPNAIFEIIIGGLDEIWLFRNVFQLEELIQPSFYDQLHIYGFHECNSGSIIDFKSQSCSHLKPSSSGVRSYGSIAKLILKDAMIETPILVNLHKRPLILYEQIADANETELAFRIFLKIADNDGNVIIVANSAFDQNITVDILKTQFRLRHFKNYGTSSRHPKSIYKNLSGKNAISVIRYDQLEDSVTGCYIIFKRCGAYGEIYPISTILDISYSNEVLIYEERNYCEFMENYFMP